MVHFGGVNYGACLVCASGIGGQTIVLDPVYKRDTYAFKIFGYFMHGTNELDFLSFVRAVYPRLRDWMPAEMKLDTRECHHLSR
jgi:hypothetical protein